jgi:hypothetical protein
VEEMLERMSLVLLIDVDNFPTVTTPSSRLDESWMLSNR